MAEEPKGRVKVTLHGGGGQDVGGASYAHFRAFHLAPGCFREYRAAIEGALYVRELRMRLTPIDKVPAILVRLRKAGFHVDAEPDLRRMLQKRDARDWLDSEALKERIARIDDELFKQTGNRMYPYQVTGSLWLARMNGALLADEMGLGKLAGISEPVLTPDGWRTMGDLKVGDEVVGSNGRSTKVLAVYPQGRKKQYRVTMTDGASTRCGAKHLWYVETTNTRFRKTKGFVFETQQLVKMGLRSNPSCGRAQGNVKWFVPLVAPVVFSKKKFELDPYVIGALIANGCLTQRTIMHHGGADQRAEMEKVWPKNFEFHSKHPVSKTIYSKPSGQAREILGRLDLLHYSYEKRIPAAYLLGSISQRTALLQGLMDNDGTVDKRTGTVEYNTTSPGLAKDVLSLIRSLGGSAWLSTRIPSYTYKGKKLKGRKDHRIRMSLPSSVVPFRLVRKIDRIIAKTKYPPIHGIESIQACGYEESVCIRVEAADHLYVTNDYILTHNSIEILVALPAKAAVIIVAPAVAKGHWRAQIRMWRPQITCEVLKGRDSFRWPKPGEILITNYDILPNIHDTEGLSGRVCTGKLLPRPCPGCDERIAFSGGMVTTIRTGHLESCSGFLPPKDCPGCHPMLQRVPHGMVLVGDEAHLLKNARSLRGMRWNALSEGVRGTSGRVWLATGTPLENEPPELWNVLRAAGLAETAFGSWDQFKASFHGKKVQYGHEWGLPGDDVKERLKRVMLRRMKREVLPDLPTKTWGDYEVELDPRALRSIDEFLRTSKKTIEEIVALVEMQEVGFEFMSSVRAALASAKIPAMLEIVKDFEEKDVPLVVFSAHRAPIDTLASRPGWVVIHGEENSEQKTRAADQFQNGYYVDPKAVLGRLHLVSKGGDDSKNGKMVEGILRRVDARGGNVIYPKGIAIVIASGGVALTLTRAAHEIFVDRAWKPTANQQAEDRLVRIGQTRGTIVTTLVANHPLDARVTEVLVRKTRLISLSIDAAADGADAPVLTEKELEKHLREIQEAIACGHAVRRIARSDSERSVIQSLHTLVFRSRSDERIAGELAEEALAVGLSDAQWELASRIVERGLLQAAERDAEAETKKMEAQQKVPATRAAPREEVVEEEPSLEEKLAASVALLEGQGQGQEMSGDRPRFPKRARWGRPRGGGRT